MCVVEYFINLTAGLEHFKQFKELNPQYIRIQSTWCEQKLWEKIILDLDNNFLMKLAIGEKCCVLDFTSRHRKNGASRAIWQGLSWIRYCLERAWFKTEIELPHGMHLYFRDQYNELTRPTKKKLKYYRKFLLTKSIDLCYICRPTVHDGDCEYYKNLLRSHYVR